VYLKDSGSDMFRRNAVFSVTTGVAVVGKGISFEIVVRRGALKTIAKNKWNAIKYWTSIIEFIRIVY
jgi:hypothetical protein